LGGREMIKSFEWLKMDDGTEVYLRKWETDGTKPEAVLHIAHGMAEHGERYDQFARFLVAKGIAVFANDHRGHGKTGEKAGLMGFFAEENGFDRVVADLYAVNCRIRSLYPGVPVFLLGHSMGSFLALRYCQIYGESIRGLILSGTGGKGGRAVKLGKMLARLEMLRKGKRAPSPFLAGLVFAGYNRKIRNPKTLFDWLSRDEQTVRAYIDDPLCGFVCTASFYYDLFTGLELIRDPRLIRQIPKKLPVFFFSGTEDPVGGYAKEVKKMIRSLKESGMENVESRFFPGGRQEMLNEINRDEVFVTVYSWMEKQLTTPAGKEKRPS